MGSVIPPINDSELRGGEGLVPQEVGLDRRSWGCNSFPGTMRGSAQAQNTRKTARQTTPNQPQPIRQIPISIAPEKTVRKGHRKDPYFCSTTKW